MSESSPTSADDPLSGRPPTVHERRAGRPWDASYTDGPAPWDIGHPQPAIARLASETDFAGPVLDAGCGTGEHALLVASAGLQVVGCDVAETAVSRARDKAAARGIDAEFVVADALRLRDLGRVFATVLDCGLFHAFEGEERHAYVASLASVAEGGATLYVLCFSDIGPELGPHPVSRNELIAAFDRSAGWEIGAIEPAEIETRFSASGLPAWLATIKRI